MRVLNSGTRRSISVCYVREGNIASKKTWYKVTVYSHIEDLSIIGNINLIVIIEQEVSNEIIRNKFFSECKQIWR